MSRSHPSPAPRRLLPALLAAGLAAALALALLATVDASSHREAPLIMEDPVADNTDVYAFVSNDRPDTVTLISNFIPFQEPGGGPNYFRFGEDVRYTINIDNNGDAVPNIVYEFRFQNAIQDPDTFLYAAGPIDSLNSPNYNFRQTMTVAETRNGQRTELGSGLTLPPENVGPRTIPDDPGYEAIAQQAIHEVGNGVRVFAGQRDDAFAVDIAAIFDLAGLRPFNDAHAAQLPTAEGRDTFAGYNVHTIALQVPIAQLVDADPVIGVWSTAERQATTVGDDGQATVAFQQISRLGMPLVNEVVIPLGLKDAFNGLQPAMDAETLTGVAAPNSGATEGDIPLVTDPILANAFAEVYGLDVPPPPREDLVAVFLTGLEGANQPAAFAAGQGQPAEMLRLNTDVPPTHDDINDNDRMGFLAGEMDGFPNGRRLGDDVVDISLRVVAGVLVDGFDVEPNNQLSDGVVRNDVPFLTSFPYMATPHQGYELDNAGRLADPIEQTAQVDEAAPRPGAPARDDGDGMAFPGGFIGLGAAILLVLLVVGGLAIATKRRGA
ncbi:MAG TPA: DUF4331 domain-containing protein [Egibacteraceae bacterium]|nr:DUF4331 domain-containing protein [Egibacteraceae bacterium]